MAQTSLCSTQIAQYKDTYTEKNQMKHGSDISEIAKLCYMPNSLPP